MECSEHQPALQTSAAVPHEEMRLREGAAQRRRFERFDYPRLVLVTPLNDDGSPAFGTPLVVVGKNLSERGLGFFHPTPLPNRRARITLETCEGQWRVFLVELLWCRFIRQGWYESGGRFAAVSSAAVRSIEVEAFLR